MLHFGAKPPFSFEKFLELCRDLIPAQDIQVLEAVYSGNPPENCQIISRWLEFEIILKNELVKIRAVRKKIDPAKYLRPDECAGIGLHHVALAAQRNPSPLEAEKILDHERWNFLDELSFGHYFDLDCLIIYAYKLLILGRWEKIRNADREQLIEGLITKN
jgi:hypothetical protein